jgi:hypothetical protein
VLDFLARPEKIDAEMKPKKEDSPRPIGLELEQYRHAVDEMVKLAKELGISEEEMVEDIEREWEELDREEQLAKEKGKDLI